jgi:hypothetical protein
MPDTTLKGELNRADLNNLTTVLRAAGLGDVLDVIASGALVDETVTVTSNVGTLANRALAIHAVYASAGTYTGTITLIPPSQTVATKLAKLATDRKTITCAGADAVTQLHVLYLPAPAGLEAALAKQAI